MSDMQERAALSSRMVGRWAGWAAVVLVVLAATPRVAEAQLGLGPRLSFVRGDFGSGTPDASFLGGTIRTMASAHSGFEFSLDYKSQLSTDGTQRERQEPFQMSLLIFPSRHRLSPYLLGGYGIYVDIVDNLGPTGLVTSSVTNRRSGFHFGGGAEFFMTKHASLYADYRFRFVQFGNSGTSTEPLHVPGVTLNHQGSMWTSGLAFYF
jgi:opacity protein-like surface antigen